MDKYYINDKLTKRISRTFLVQSKKDEQQMILDGEAYEVLYELSQGQNSEFTLKVTDDAFEPELCNYYDTIPIDSVNFNILEKHCTFPYDISKIPEVPDELIDQFKDIEERIIDRIVMELFERKLDATTENVDLVLKTIKK